MPLSGKDLIKLLKREGWIVIRIHGSHIILSKGKTTVSVPSHGNRALGVGLEQKLLKQTGLKK